MFCICHSTGDIADFDDDDKIGKKDLEKVINRLTWSNPEAEDEIEKLISNVSAKIG